MRVKTILSLSALLFLSGFMTTGRNSERPPSSDILETVRHFVDVQNSRNVEAIVSQFPESLDIQVFKPDGTIEKHNYDKAEQRARFADSVKYVPHAHFEIISVIVSEPFVITRELATGLPEVQSQHAITMYRVADRKIAAIWDLNEEEPESQR
jgi:hypothetical protein